MVSRILNTDWTLSVVCVVDEDITVGFKPRKDVVDDFEESELYSSS